MISHVCYKAMDAPNCFGSCIFVHLRLTPQLFGIHVYEQTDSNRVRHVTHYCFSSYMNTLSVSRFEWGQYGASQKGMKVFRYCTHAFTSAHRACIKYKNVCSVPNVSYLGVRNLPHVSLHEFFSTCTTNISFSRK